MFHKSKKTDSGGLKSDVGWKGLAKKFASLLFVIVAYRLDVALGTDYLKNAVIIGFSCNECLSIIENAGLIGVPIPNVLKNAIEVLKDKVDNKA